RLDFAEGVQTIAADPDHGLLAVSTRDDRFSGLALNLQLAGCNGGAGQGDARGYGHPAFPSAPAPGTLPRLAFHEGTPYAADATATLTRLPIAPTPYRRFGWAYYDLDAWLAPPDPAGGSDPDSGPAWQPKLMPELVLYAQDRFENEAPAF